MYDFPNSPTYGQVFEAYTWDGEKWISTVGGVGTGVAATTFDGAASDVTKSNGNLTATHANSNDSSGTRSLSFQTSGKYYFEVTATGLVASGDCIGVLSKSGSFIDMVLNGVKCGVVYRSGTMYYNDAGGGLGLGASINNGDVIGAAVDLDNSKIWFRKSPSGNWNGLAIGSQNPVGAVGGASISNIVAGGVAPAIGFGNSTSQAVTANFGALSFSGVVPTGFTPGWPVRTGGPEWLTAYVVTMTTDSPGWVGYTLRNVLAKGALGHTGTKYRLTLSGGTSEGSESLVYVGPAAGSGDAYDASSLTQNLKAGSGTIDTGVGGVVVLDEVVAALDVSKALVLSMQFANAAKDTIRVGPAANIAQYYYRAGTTEAATLNATTGYTAPGAQGTLVSKIEVWA